MKLGSVLSTLLGTLHTAGEHDKCDILLVGCIRAILGVVDENQLKPLGPLVWVYVLSALTHLKLAIRLLGLQVLDACLKSDALFRAIDEEKLLNSLSATLTNKFQSGLSASSNVTRQKIWATVLHFQQRKREILMQKQSFRVAKRFAPIHRVYSCRVDTVGESDGLTDLILPMLLNELFEYIPGTDAAMTTMLLRSFCLIYEDATPAQKTSGDIVRTLNHLAGNFPLQQMDSSARMDFSEANIRVAALLLRSRKALWVEVVAEFVSKRLEDHSLLEDLREILLGGCAGLWKGSNFKQKVDLDLVRAFSIFYGTRLSASVRVACNPVLELLLCNRRLPKETMEQLLKGCARSLWQQGGNSAAKSVLSALYQFTRQYPGPAASELLNRLLVPMFSVNMGKKIVQGSFCKFGVVEQVACVRLYSTLEENASEGLREAWLRLLSDSSTHSAAGESLITVLYDRRAVLFPHTSSYLSFMSSLLFHHNCSLSIARATCFAILNVLPEWPEAFQMSDSSEFSLLVFEKTLINVLNNTKDVDMVAKGLLLLGLGSQHSSTREVLTNLLNSVCAALVRLMSENHFLVKEILSLFLPLMEDELMAYLEKKEKNFRNPEMIAINLSSASLSRKNQKILTKMFKQ
jgi:hypothetical protein